RLDLDCVPMCSGVQQSGSPQTLLEFDAVAGGPRAVEETCEVLQQRIGPAERHQCEPVGFSAEEVLIVEIMPVIRDRLLALLVHGAKGERPLYLPDELSPDAGPVLSDDEEIVGLSPEPLGLEMNLRHRAVADDRWDRPDQEQREPVGTDMLLENGSRSSGRGRTRDSWFGNRVLWHPCHSLTDTQAEDIQRAPTD